MPSESIQSRSIGWDDVESFLRDGAAADVQSTGEITPCFVAFAEEVPLFVAYLRPFPKGRYADPLIELFALAGPLGADRIAVAFGGRAWSLDDPVPPVSPDADLRQRVLAVHRVDGSAEPVRTIGVLWPFDERDGRVQWGAAIREQHPRGWIPQALEVMLRGRHELAASDDDIAAQAARCVALGHRLYRVPGRGQ